MAVPSIHELAVNLLKGAALHELDVFSVNFSPAGDFLPPAIWTRVKKLREKEVSSILNGITITYQVNIQPSRFYTEIRSDKT